jgi:hypothetical protein
VTVEAWRILKVLEEVQREGGRVTLAALADLVRGLGGGSFGVVQQGKGRKRKLGEEKGRVDVVDVAGGKVELNKDVSGWNGLARHSRLVCSMNRVGDRGVGECGSLGRRRGWCDELDSSEPGAGPTSSGEKRSSL